MKLLVLLVLCSALAQGCCGSRYLPELFRSAFVIRRPKLQGADKSTTHNAHHTASSTSPLATPLTPPAPHHTHFMGTPTLQHPAQSHPLSFSYAHRQLSSLEDTPPSEPPRPPQDAEASSPPKSAPEPSSEPSAASAPDSLIPPEDEIAVVKSLRDLWSAVSQGKQHIEIQEHINLASDDDPQTGSMLIGLTSTVRSIRGNCATAPTAALLGLSAQSKPLLNLKPRQCVLVVNRTLLKVSDSAVWVDGIYVRVVASPSGTPDTAVQAMQSSLLWMTRVTLQGSGNEVEHCEVCGFSASSQSSVFVDGCIFADFDTNVVGEVRQGAAVSMRNCLFSTNTVVDGVQGGAILSAHASSSIASSPDDNDDAPVGGFRLEGCTFTGNSVPREELVLEVSAAQKSPLFLSDSMDVGMCSRQDQCLDCFLAQPQCADMPLIPLEETPEGMFLDDDHPLLLELQEQVETASYSESAAAPTSDASSPLRNQSEPFSGPKLVVIPVTVLLLLAAAVFWYRRRQALRMNSSTATTTSYAVGARILKSGSSVTPQCEQSGPAKSSSNPLYDSEECAGPRRVNNASSTEASCVEGSSAPEASATCIVRAETSRTEASNGAQGSEAANGASQEYLNGLLQQWAAGEKHACAPTASVSDGTLGIDSSCAGTTVRATTFRKTPPTLVPSAESTLQRRMTFVHQQLDCFGPEELLLRRYRLLGRGERRCGAQTVVQFAKGTVGGRDIVFALKFFTSRNAFIEERKLYKEYPRALREFMPDVMDIVENKEENLKDPFDNALPPFIVMEKGEGLRDRASSPTMDVFATAQVLGHVSRLIEDLHEIGFVHRDLKPGNMIWEPHTSAWVLIDFGLVARIGSKATVGFTPTYAAPEAAKAYRTQTNEMLVGTQLDAWAVGVIALELMLGKAPFGKAVVCDEVIDALADPTIPLPWEGDELPLEDRQKLGGTLDIILPLLHRDPTKRGTVRDFRIRIDGLLDREP